jgi:acyl carrier protein
VARIFAQVLDLGPGAPVGADDDFFQLGGHSLLLPRVLHEVAAAFEVEVPLRTLYEESTVAELALAIEELVIEELERLEPAS